MKIHLCVKRRGVEGLNIVELPYEVKLYGNGQLLIPAKLVKALNIAESRYILVTIRSSRGEATFKAKLLKTRKTHSRQFTVPKQLRDELNIKGGDVVSVIRLVPL